MHAEMHLRACCIRVYARAHTHTHMHTHIRNHGEAGYRQRRRATKAKTEMETSVRTCKTGFTFTQVIRSTVLKFVLLRAWLSEWVLLAIQKCVAGR